MHISYILADAIFYVANNFRDSYFSIIKQIWKTRLHKVHTYNGNVTWHFCNHNSSSNLFWLRNKFQKILFSNNWIIKIHLGNQGQKTIELDLPDSTLIFFCYQGYYSGRTVVSARVTDYDNKFKLYYQN